MKRSSFVRGFCCFLYPKGSLMQMNPHIGREKHHEEHTKSRRRRTQGHSTQRASTTRAHSCDHRSIVMRVVVVIIRVCVRDRMCACMVYVWFRGMVVTQRELRSRLSRAPTEPFTAKVKRGLIMQCRAHTPIARSFAAHGYVYSSGRGFGSEKSQFGGQQQCLEEAAAASRQP